MIDFGHDYAVAPGGTDWLARQKKVYACEAKCVNAAEGARR
jgi:hypothetical protein